MLAAEGHLLLVSWGDGPGQALNHALRALKPVRHVRALSGSMPIDMPSAIVLAGAPLGDAPSLAAIRAGLAPFLHNKVPVLCVLDRPSARDDMQARAIGASAIVPAGSSARALGDVLRTLTGRSPDRGEGGSSPAIERAVQEAGFVVADLMATASSGTGVSASLTLQASNLLLHSARVEGLGQWMRTVSTIHDQTYRHCLLMAGLVAAFVVSLGLNPSDCTRLTSAAILHDVGKALLPLEILDKPGPLTATETAVMQAHAELGYQLLRKQGDHHPTTLDVARHHHEYLDGSGYPDGRKGSEVSDEVRIATICDIFSALIEQRSYKTTMRPSEALDLMTLMTTQLDQDLLRAFRPLFSPSR